ncbi:metal-dependent hydrolase [Parendozoicomonas haliclonae]|uniref:Putative metal-dependent hydrolase n=1 Tax=Parendozoicomonas haliclonae TaxID=1960125 RepID=A0A1X7AEH3_9GAMM|nr:metal-dependent hydrolase [Parendozoicomonas haliclonae]SMA32851.1 putative metal-dependent hydrolase [Parendozoicomonas haliclonae]
MNNNDNHSHAGDVAIQPRRMVFPFKQMKAKRFFDNNALKSALVAALSSTFPPGEGEFIASVRNYRDQIQDPVLKEQIRGFIGQEGHHSHQHKQANRALKELGWDAERLEVGFQKELDRRAPKLKKRFRLAMTVGMEHVTAIMAQHLLNNPQVFDSLEPAARELLYWHAVEEIEHKAVAFDVFMLCDGDQKYLRRILRLATVLFAVRIGIYMVLLMKWGRMWPSWKEVKSFASFLWGKEGFMTAMKQPYKDYFKPGFHPWDHKNQHLVEKWETSIYNPKYDRASEQFQAEASPA